MSPRSKPDLPVVLLLVVFLTGTALAVTLHGIPIHPGDTATTAVEPAGDEDLFTFEGLADGRLTVKLGAVRGSALVPSLRVLDPLGAVIDVGIYYRVKKGKISLKKLPLRVSGQYGVLVAGSDGTTGAYRMKTKAVWPKKRTWKRETLGARETIDFRIPSFDGLVAKVTIRNRGPGDFEPVALLDPDGEEVPGVIEALARNKGGVKGTLVAQGRTGDYILRIQGAVEATVLDVTVKARVPKHPKRRLDISPLEPEITSLNPTSGWQDDVIAVTGANFASTGVTVLFGETPSPKVAFGSSETIYATVPEGDGELAIRLGNPDGQWCASPMTFEFRAHPPVIHSVNPESGPDFGGTTVVISGTGLKNVVAVSIGGVPVASGPVVLGQDRIRVVTAAATAGISDLELLDRWGQIKVLRGVFTYVGTPEIRSVSPRSGTEKGGTLVKVTGRWFLPDVLVYLDDRKITVEWLGQTLLQFIAPPHAKGVVDLEITDTHGRSGIMVGAYQYSDAAYTDVTDTVMPANADGAVYGGGAIAIEDLDGDRDVDILLGRTTGDASSVLTSLLLNDGTGRFTPGKLPAPPVSTDAWNAADLAVGDLDKDGDLDLVLTCGQRFQDPATYSYFVGKVPHVAHDRIFASTRVLLNDGKGGFAVSKTAFPGMAVAGTDVLQASALALGDVDGDKDLDLVLTSKESIGEVTYKTSIQASFVHRYFSVAYLDDRPATRLFLNDGKGVFKDATSVSIPGVKNGDMFAGDDVLIGNVDGDADPDIVITGDGDSLRDSKQPEFVKGSKTRVLLNDGSAYFTNGTAAFMPPIVSGDDWGGRKVTIGDLDGDESRDDLIITTDRTLTTEAESLQHLPSTRVFLGSAKSFSIGTGDWLPHVRTDGKGDLHRGSASLITSLPGDSTACVFLVGADEVYAMDSSSGTFDRQVASLRWFRHGGELPLVNVSERLLPDPAARNDYYLGHALALGDLDGDGTDELVITTDHEDYRKEGMRPTRVLKLR